MREKELRLALVCYGGVSLAIYMHGITKEVWKLLRASAARTHGEAPSGDTEIVYAALLDELEPHLNLRVLVDIVAGASAGGINGILLSHAIAGGHDMEPLRDLWLAGADVDRLLDPQAVAHGRMSKWWATPLVWYARSKGYGMADDVVDPAARVEVRAKLSRFMRSRWFRPPFSGVGFTAMLYDALKAMETHAPAPPLIPEGLPLDLFVTVTDFHGRPEALALHSPPQIIETEHRLVIDFHSSGEHAGPRSIGDPAELAFAARATASFPGAFPPAQVGEIDAVLAERNAAWLGRTAFLKRIFPRRAAMGQVYEQASLIDGSVLNNRPFGPAIEALRHRPAHREVDRRFVYIDPKPGAHGGKSTPGEPPGFFTTILRALADIPREQPIRDNLEAIAALSVRVRRLRQVVDGMAGQVDTAIEGAIGARFFFLPLSAARLSDWRSRAQTVAAQRAGFAYSAYGQLKLAQVVDGIAARIAALGGSGPGVTAYVASQALVVEDAAERGGAGSAYVGFLRRFDLDFRIRRLRFLLRRLNRLAVAQIDLADRHAIEALKASMYALLAPYLDRRRDEFYGDDVRAGVAGEPAAAMAAFEAALDLRALDTATDARLVELFAMDLTKDVRRALLRAYLGFPFYDIAMLPLLQGDGLDEFDEIKVDRIAPEDATTIRGGGYMATLKGTQFNSFGAFFSRAYRENDYLWGRLHAADRLIDIVVSTVDDAIDPVRIAALKKKAFDAILDAERPFLTAIPDLFATLRREIDAA
ncbi:patatin-like protein [Polymorphobacter megasporae]|uniref:patatin-like protein n=1 Tax=Glacieibacterium megasporae TaxID=2835787 RepID=UPI001C1E2F18|nr:patatin-like protein [Polymorphobacter megasporae]UAJ10740.1 patatin-like protein [Polymorphobacter megasporae]